MVDDIIKDFKASLYERTASPLFVTFAASWSIWNYRLILAILSSAELEAKLTKLDKLVPIEWYERMWQFGIGPLATSLAFLFIYPFPARWVYKFWQTQQKLLKETRQKIEDETPLTLAEARQIRSQFRELELRYRKDVDDKEALIGDLRARYDALERAEPNSKNETVWDRLAPLTVAQESTKLGVDGSKGVLAARRRVVIDLMRKLEDNGNKAYEEAILGNSGLARSESLLAIDELLQDDLVKHYDDGESFYAFTKKGRLLAVGLKEENSKLASTEKQESKSKR